jgi:hypothetical protein
MGGPVTAIGFNFGNIRWRDRTAENAIWWDLSSGQMPGKNGGIWFTFPSPDVGMAAWGRFLKQSVGGAYIPLLRMKRWREFAEIYFGVTPGLDPNITLEEYVAGLEDKAIRYTARAAAAGVEW